MKPEEIFQERFLELVNTNKYTLEQIGEKIGIKSKGTISKYLSGEIQNVKRSVIFDIATLYGVSPAWLAGLSDNKYIDKSPTNSTLLKVGFPVPVYGQISAGQPNWAEENLEGYLPLDPELMGIANPEEHYFLRVNGESMNKVIRNGAFALIHKQDYVENGEIAVVFVNGNNATLKRFTKEGNIIVLTPESTDDSFKQQVYTKDTDVRIIGKYVGKMEFNQ